LVLAAAIRRWRPDREAAQSTMSRQLRPRLEEADTIGTSICPYCAVGCAQLVYAKNGHVIHIEGDPRSPINQGILCPKGQRPSVC
jgi:formate dehydrogenase major subunit